MSLSKPLDTASTQTPTPHPTTRSGARRILLWDLPLRVFHWSLLAAVTTAIVSGKIGGDLMGIHAKAGLAIVGLVAFRLVWGLVGSTHSRFSHFLPTPARILAYVQGRWQGVGHNPLGALSVFGLLGVLAVQAGMGLFTNDDIAFLGPLASLVSESWQQKLTGYHHQLANLLFVLIGLHVLAIVFYARAKKDNLVKPMVTGWKETPLGESTRGGGPVVFGVSVALAALAVFAANGVFLSPDTPAAKDPAPDTSVTAKTADAAEPASAAASAGASQTTAPAW
jgi:cytochrome b